MFGKTRFLYNDGNEGGTGGENTPVDRGPQYSISKQVRESGYGVDIKGRKISIVKDKYETMPDPITNEPKRLKTANAFVVDSTKEGDPDLKQDYIDGLNDEEFKMLADANVIVLDKAAEERYKQVLRDTTNTKELPVPKK